VKNNTKREPNVSLVSRFLSLDVMCVLIGILKRTITNIAISGPKHISEKFSTKNLGKNGRFSLGKIFQNDMSISFVNENGFARNS